MPSSASSSGPSGPETISSAPRMESAPRVSEVRDSKEVKDVSEDIGVAASVETVDATGLEDSINVLGQVSETLRGKASENQGASSGQAQSGQSGQSFDPAAIRAQLLKNLPTEPAMRRQIEKEVKKEIKYLHKKAAKLMRSTGSVNYFEMCNILKKIRELKGILMTLVKASLESMKTLWLRFVHGVM